MNSEPSKQVVTRFAPSPTGFMHIGGIRTALYAYLFAKKMNGTFILRIEDTDKAREIEGSIEHIKKSLNWLGITWDYGPDKPGPFGSTIQSERLDSYKSYAEKLIKKGLAYPDPYTKEEVDAFRAAAEHEHRPFLFRDHRPEVFETWDGTKPLRLKVPQVKRYVWEDAVRGTLEAGEEMQTGTRLTISHILSTTSRWVSPILCAATNLLRVCRNSFRFTMRLKYRIPSL